MAARKKQVKPLFAVKHDFVDSLDRCIEEAVLLLGICQTALQLDQIGPAIRPKFEERVNAFEATLLSEDEPQ